MSRIWFRYSSRALVGQPDDLEGVVAFDQAVGVVVDRLAGPRQQAGRRVVGAEDQLGVGLAALQAMRTAIWSMVLRARL